MKFVLNWDVSRNSGGELGSARADQFRPQSEDRGADLMAQMLSVRSH